MGSFAKQYLYGARVTVGAVWKEDEATGRVGEGVARESCFGFPLTQLYNYF